MVVCHAVMNVINTVIKVKANIIGKDQCCWHSVTCVWVMDTGVDMDMYTYMLVCWCVGVLVLCTSILCAPC